MRKVIALLFGAIALSLVTGCYWHGYHHHHDEDRHEWHDRW